MNELSNAASLEALLDEAEQLGETSGSGESALPTLAMKVAIGVRQGAFVNIEVAKGKENDIHTVWKRYAKGKNAKAPAERSQKSINSQVAKLQAIAKAAERMTDFAGDVMVRVSDAREKLIADTTNKPKVWDLYHSYVNCAVEQIKPENTGILSDEQIDARIRKTSKGKTLVEHLQAMQEAIDALREPDSVFQIEPQLFWASEDASRNIGILVDAAKRAAMTDEEREEHDAMQAARNDVLFARRQKERAETERALQVGREIEAEKAETLAA